MKLTIEIYSAIKREVVEKCSREENLKGRKSCLDKNTTVITNRVVTNRGLPEQVMCELRGGPRWEVNL